MEIFLETLFLQIPQFKVTQNETLLVNPLPENSGYSDE